MPTHPIPSSAQVPASSTNTPFDMAAALLWAEKEKYERSSQVIRDKLLKAYRNYFGVFTKPKTNWTKRKKTFIPMTKWFVNSVAGQVFVGPKAVGVLPVEEQDVKRARVWQELIRFQLERLSFEEKMMDIVQNLSLLGTVVVNISWDLSGKQEIPNFIQIPLLNCYIDPTADSIQSAPSFIVKYLIPKQEAIKVKHLKGVKDFAGVKVVDSRHSDITAANTFILGQSQQVEHEEEMIWVWQRWGPIPLSWLGELKKGEEDKKVEGVIWAVGRSQSDFKVLSIKRNPYKHGMRPFVEAWYRKLPGRWYGIGVGEDLEDLQEYLNRIVNQRIDNAEIVQHKMFLYRKGSGIDPRMFIAKPGGAIPVNDVEKDVKALEYTDIRKSSYNDEANILSLAQQVTNAFDIIRGGGTAGTATEAIIQERGAGGAFSHIRRYINGFLTRLVDQMLKLDQQFLTQEFVVRVIGNKDELQEIDDVLDMPVGQRVQEKFRFIKVKNAEEIKGNFDVRVDIDNSAPINKAVLINFILRSIELAKGDPESQINRQELYKELFELQGMRGDRFFQQQQILPQVPPGPETQKPTSEGERPALGQTEQALMQQVTSPQNIITR